MKKNGEEVEAIARAEYAGKEMYATFDAHVGGFMKGYGYRDVEVSELERKLHIRTEALAASIERNITHKEDIEKLVVFIQKLKKNLSNAGRLAPYESDEIAAIIGKHL